MMYDGVQILTHSSSGIQVFSVVMYIEGKFGFGLWRSRAMSWKETTLFEKVSFSRWEEKRNREEVKKYEKVTKSIMLNQRSETRVGMFFIHELSHFTAVPSQNRFLSRIVTLLRKRSSILLSDLSWIIEFQNCSDKETFKVEKNTMKTDHQNNKNLQIRFQNLLLNF